MEIDRSLMGPSEAGWRRRACESTRRRVLAVTLLFERAVRREVSASAFGACLTSRGPPPLGRGSEAGQARLVAEVRGPATSWATVAFLQG
jgi:hypothetical protein